MNIQLYNQQTMPKLFDEDGNEVEVPTQEEIDAWKQGSERAAELETSLKAKEEELSRLSSKDFNFKELRAAEAAKRDEMLNAFSEKEKTLILEVEKTQKQQEEHEQRYFGEAKDAALKALAGEDVDLRAKLEEAVKDSHSFLGAPKDSRELIQRYEKAYTIVEGTQKTVNPIHAYSPVTGQYKEPGQKANRFTDTPEGDALFKAKFGKEIEKVKKTNPNLFKNESTGEKKAD